MLYADRPGAPVAAPLDWDELDAPGLTARRWTLRDLGDRLDRDPWAGLNRHGRGLTAAARRLRGLRGERGVMGRLTVHGAMAA
ncbi:hypothetical protein ACIQOF_22175 [Streptomyces sp. NPDC091265]|uniref:hypothetical protein n=1 Tax=unclassified Streptomyces TaxID=2593676 RepID=UPI00344BCC24